MTVRAWEATTDFRWKGGTLLQQRWELVVGCGEIEESEWRAVPIVPADVNDTLEWCPTSQGFV